MKKTELIDKSSYLLWRENPVTISLMEFLEKLRDSIKEDMLGEELILNTDGRQLSRLLGYKQGIEEVLNLEWEDEEENDNAEVKTSNAQSVS